MSTSHAHVKRLERARGRTPPAPLRARLVVVARCVARRASETDRHPDTPPPHANPFYRRPVATTTTRSRWVFDPGWIAARYARSGWLFLDVVSILPLDALLGSPQLRALRALKLVRLTKLLKLSRLQAVFKRLNESTGMPYAYGTLVQYLVYAFFLTHWCACLWAALPVTS